MIQHDNDKINVPHVLGNTLSMWINSLDKTRAFGGKLLAQTMDKEGYEDLMGELDELESVLTDYKKSMDEEYS